jgi:hypothetical protein
MLRLPIKFEEEVLSNHGVYWIDDDCGYMNYDQFINKYELVGYGIEAARLQLIPMEPNTWVCYGYINNMMYRLSEDIDFKECVFKAINEVYKE